MAAYRSPSAVETSTESTSPASAPDAKSLADAVERLSAEFQPELPAWLVLSTLRRCRRELDIISGPALPELVERLGRQRLSDIVIARRGTAPRRTRGSRQSLARTRATAA